VLAPLSAVEVEWRYAGTEKICVWRGRLFEKKGKGNTLRWPVQFEFLDSTDGRITRVQSELPCAPRYNGCPVEIVSIRPVDELGPIRHVVLRPVPKPAQDRQASAL